MKTEVSGGLPGRTDTEGHQTEVGLLTSLLPLKVGTEQHKQLALLCVGQKESQFRGVRDLRLRDERMLPLMPFPSPVTPQCLQLLELTSAAEAPHGCHYTLPVFLSFPACGASGQEMTCFAVHAGNYFMSPHRNSLSEHYISLSLLECHGFIFKTAEKVYNFRDFGTTWSSTWSSAHSGFTIK